MKITTVYIDGRRFFRCETKVGNVVAVILNPDRLTAVNEALEEVFRPV